MHDAHRAREIRKHKKKAPASDCWGFVFGAGDESRTRDLNLGKVALYQLSYSRMNNMCVLLQALNYKTI